ncbi:OmpH family outer membrane protein [Paracoccus aestuariivivens]|uniref:OmpH family outer membrane protein n=1 Tax=Paracoccus aestuariivivens TaxID=1820333 RepID=A0A6L6JD11_9RHOB|nr:OmpH family outer membrane protein [Paracoccus aestuariivivens]MTH80073.1 OmpH family outer membrane protein [Paracoccus aestuariivivens]
MCRLSSIAALVAVLGTQSAWAQTDPQTPPVIEPPAVTQPLSETPAPGLIVESADPQNGQSSPGILTIDQEELFSASKWGKRVQADLEKKSREIADENERLAVQFSNEEEQLTTLRGTLPADEFRKRADEFDKRVVEVRRQRDSVGRELQEHVDEERAAFFRAALPELAQVMKERGAVVVLDQRAIFVSAQTADITAVMIERLDTNIGAGPAENAAPAKP